MGLNSSNELIKLNEYLFKKYNSVFDDDLFYEKEKSDKIIKKNRPLIFLSSTSWTPDEDFDILLNAVVISEKELKKRHLKMILP